MTAPVAGAAPPLLDIRDVAKRYGRVAALAGVSLEIGQGEFVALLGPSGCGKTTLLRCIAGFVAPDRGVIAIDGADVTALPPHRRPLNTVFQNYALFPHMTVAENVGYGPARRGVPRAEIAREVAAALAMVGLDGFGPRRPNQLSGGQQQRVALARALINRPRLLLLDEPLGALDLKLRKQMQLELKRLQARLGITFVFVTHDQEEAMTMADRIVVMEGGSIAQAGPAAEIYARPCSRFVAGFIGEANLLDLVADPDGRLRARIGGAAIVAPLAGSGAGVGLSRVGMLRAEALRPATADVPDAVAATVTDVVDTGGQVLVHLDAAGTALMMRRLGDARAAFSAGQRIHVAWSPEALHVLPEQAG